MKRGLNSRHISMIAIGGAIGTGLLWQLKCHFSSWPRRSYISLYTNWYYALFLMSSIGELATFYPVSGSLVHTLPDLLIRHLVLQWVGCIGVCGHL